MGCWSFKIVERGRFLARSEKGGGWANYPHTCVHFVRLGTVRGLGWCWAVWAAWSRALPQAGREAAAGPCGAGPQGCDGVG
jgi:hypothetical protein